MAYITKPIALDETLQDVVTAIQGITQGGMIVSTGNVGSSTQPVYINGGVPTAIQPEDAARSFGFLTRGTNAVNIDTTDGNWTMAITPSSAQGTMPWTDYWAQITQFRSGAFCTQIATLIRYSSSDRPDRLAIRHKYAEAGSSYVWSSWKMVYGVTTGTASLNSQYISSGSITYAKSGNVVNVWMEGVTIGSSDMPSGKTLASNLPGTALGRNRLWIKANTTDYLFNMFQNGTLVLGGSNAIPSGAGIVGSFTYITSD